MTKQVRARPLMVLAAILGLGAPIAIAPAVAKEKPKKEEAEKGNSIPASKKFLPFVQKMIAANTAKDAAALEAAIAEGQAAVETDGDRYWMSFYELQLGILSKSQEMQSKALDALVASALTPAGNLGIYNFYSGNFAYSAKDYAKAIQRLEAARAAGSTEAILPTLLMDSYLNAGQLDQGLALAKSAIEANRAAGQKPSDELYVRPIRALQAAGRTEEMLDMMTLRLRDHNQPAVWRQAIYLYMQHAKPSKEIVLDSLRLMRATGAMTDREDYLEYAKLATDAAQPGEVVKLIQQGRRANVIPAGDATFNERETSQAERDKGNEATLTAYASRPETLGNAKVAGATADTMVGYGRYGDAIPLYKAAIANGGDKEVWGYRLGVAQALAGNADAAKTSFSQISGPYKRLADLWIVNIGNAAAAPTSPAVAEASN